MADTTRSKITSSLRDLDLERHLSDPALRQSYGYLLAQLMFRNQQELNLLTS
jgi:hypothetical protein